MYSCSTGMLSLLIKVCISLHKSPFQHKKEYCSDKVLSNTFGRTQVVERKGKRMFSLKRRINGHWKYHVQKKDKSLSENSAYLLCIVSFKSVLIRKETCIPEAQVICDFLLPGLIFSCFVVIRTPEGWSTTKQKELWQHQHKEGAKPVRRFWARAQSGKEQSSVFSARANALPPSPGQQHGKMHSCTPLTWLYLGNKQNVGILSESRYVKKQQSALRISIVQSSPLTALLQLHVSF